MGQAKDNSVLSIPGAWELGLSQPLSLGQQQVMDTPGGRGNWLWGSPCALPTSSILLPAWPVFFHPQHLYRLTSPYATQTQLSATSSRKPYLLAAVGCYSVLAAPFRALNAWRPW